METVSKEVEILVSPKKCFDAICDFESYPQWQKTIKEVTILDKEGGRPMVVEYKLDAVIKTIQYTLNYIYEDSDPKKMMLAWTYGGGDLKKIEGSYLFTELAPNKTKAVYTLDLELGLTVPNFILKKFRESMMEESVLALKKRAESLK